jgi:hypothetical protein|uniref:Uncharacterized protein n=1 Tax=Picea glauca TaxID=3330 RepID=A0A101LUZ2_PICGL|nr:hypothetical protein ABT39_MTgene2174 [Picea glauca]
MSEVSIVASPLVLSYSYSSYFTDTYFSRNRNKGETLDNQSMNHKSLKKERIKKQFYYILSDQPKSRESQALKGIQTMIKYTLSVHLAHPL